MSVVAILMRSCLLAFGVVAASAVAAGLARAQSIDFGRHHALVIGNNDYEQWTRLTTAVRDAQEVADVLEHKYGFEVRLLENATASQIVRALNQLRSDLTEVDNLLIYYAGHGHLDGDTGFWIGIDGDKNFEDSWVSVSTITRNLDRMSARHVLVVADSCFSGTLTRGDDDAGLRTGRERSAWLGRMTEKRARLALTSGGLEPVSDVGGGGHSVFAKEFLDALRENDQVLEGQALFGRIKQDVVLNANQTPDYGKIRLASDDGGDFLFVPRDLQVATVAEQQNFGPQRGAGESLQPDFQVWAVVQHSTNPIDLQTFIETFPESIWAPFARNRLAKLDASQSSEETAALTEPESLEEGQESLKPAATVPEAEPELAALESAREKPVTASPVEPAIGVYEQPTQYQPGDEFRECDECPLMVVVPPGSFMMGSTAFERQRAVDQGAERSRVELEMPPHQVTIPEPFALGKYEATFNEWEACVEDGGCGGYKPGDQGWGRGRRPVINVSWKDAKAYVEWLSEKTGKPYRLLSEAEWEYAARAGTTTRYWWGNAITRKNANSGGYLGKTAKVGSYPPNAWGLFDMHGNVWEWGEDCIYNSYLGAPNDGSAWNIGGCSGGRVARGGSWGDDPWAVRSAVRGSTGPSTDRRGKFEGFRVAKTID